MSTSNSSNSSSFWTVRNTTPDQSAASKKTISVEIQKIPQSLSELKQAQKIEGEVIRQNYDGSVRIRTDQGDIDIKIRVQNTRVSEQLQPGQKIEIDLPAGKTPYRTLVQLLPQNAGAQTKSNTQSSGQYAAQTPQDTVDLGSTLRNGQAETTNALKPQPVQQLTVTQGQILRMLPLPPGQLAAMLQPESAPFQTQTSFAPRIQAALEALLIQIPETQIETLLQTLSSSMLQALPSPSQQMIFQPGAIKAQDTSLIFHLLNWNNSSGSTQSPAHDPSLLFSSLSSSLSGGGTGTGNTQATFSLLGMGTSISSGLLQANPVLSSLPPTLFNAAEGLLTLNPSTPFSGIPAAAQKLDIQIRNILPPQIEFLSPQMIQSSKISMPVQPPNLILPTLKAGVAQGTIIGQTAQNLPILSFTPPTHNFPQSFILQAPISNFSTGTQIQFSSMPVLGAAGGLANTALSPAWTNTLPDIVWPPLTELLETLMALGVLNDKQLAQILPSVGHTKEMGPALLFFLSAIRSGNITNFFSHEKLDLLRQLGKTELINRLSQDTGTLSRLMTEPRAAGQDWKTIPIPMFCEGQVEKIVLHYKREDTENDKDQQEKDDQTRFIMELDLSRMGSVQIDALARPGKLDMIVRTQSALSLPMRQTMRRLYVEALEYSRISGELSFQHKPEQWVTVHEMEQKIGLST